MSEVNPAEPDRLGRFLAAQPNQEIITSFAGGFASVMTLEYARAALVNPESSPSTYTAQAAQSDELPEHEKPQPIITQEDVPPFVYETLQHGGNILEGYFFTAVMFSGLAAVRLKRLTNKARVLTAASLTTGVIAYHELFRQKPDPADIPAGIIGATAVVGLVHLFSKDGSGRKSKQPTNFNSPATVE